MVNGSRIEPGDRLRRMTQDAAADDPRQVPRRTSRPPGPAGRACPCAPRSARRGSPAAARRPAPVAARQMRQISRRPCPAYAWSGTPGPVTAWNGPSSSPSSIAAATSDGALRRIRGRPRRSAAGPAAAPAGRAPAARRRLASPSAEQTSVVAPPTSTTSTSPTWSASTPTPARTASGVAARTRWAKVRVQRPEESRLPPITWRRNTSRMAARAGSGRACPIRASRSRPPRPAPGGRAAPLRLVRGLRVAGDHHRHRHPGAAEPVAALCSSTSALPPSVPPTSSSTSGRAARSARQPGPVSGPACTCTTRAPADSADPAARLGADLRLVPDHRQPQPAARAGADEQLGRQRRAVGLLVRRPAPGRRPRRPARHRGARAVVVGTRAPDPAPPGPRRARSLGSVDVDQQRLGEGRPDVDAEDGIHRPVPEPSSTRPSGPTRRNCAN